MEGVLLVLVLVVNVLISWWNCYAVGTAWKDVHADGNGVLKFLLWCGAIQSVVGFSMPILLVLSHVGMFMLTIGDEPTFTPAEAAVVMKGVYSLWYVLVIVPVVGTGLAITAHSVFVAYKRRDWASIGGAGWNVFAQVNNTLSMIENLGGALKSVGEVFSLVGSSDDARGKAIMFVLACVVVSLAGGAAITFGLIRYYANRTTSSLESYAIKVSRERGHDRRSPADRGWA